MLPGHENGRRLKAYLSVPLLAVGFVLASCAPVGPEAPPSPTDTIAVQASPTPAPPTEAPTASPTPEPTATDTPTYTPTPGRPMFTVTSSANCRRGPGVVYDIVTASRAGSAHPILGQSSFFGPLWWRVGVNGVECWIWSGLGETSGPIDRVAQVAAPPTPTPRPTPIQSPTPAPLVNPFPLTVTNRSGVNLCFLFIVPNNTRGWGSSRLPANVFLPVDGRVAFNLSAGKYNLRAEDCKDDIVEILVDFSLTAPKEWVIDGETADDMVLP